MIEGQALKDRRQLLFGVLGQHPVYGREMFLLRRAGLILIHIEDQRLEKVAFAVVPEMIALAGAGIANDGVGEHLGHERVAV